MRGLCFLYAVVDCDYTVATHKIIVPRLQIRRMAVKYFLLTVTVVLLGLFFLNQLDQQESETARTIQAEIRNIKTSITLPGEVISQNEARIVSPRSGRLFQVLVEEGQLVKKDQLLARLDGREALAWLNRSKATLRLEQNKIDHFTRTLERLQRMSDVGGESAQHVDTSMAQLESAKALADIAKTDVELAKIAVTDSDIVAVHNGTIVQSLAQPGEWVDPTRFLFRLADTESIVIEAKVDGADIDSLKMGQPVIVATEGAQKSRWEESVKWISPAAERKGVANTFRVHISLGEEKPNLRIGQQVDLEIITGFRENALVLPIETINYSQEDTPRIGVLEVDKIVWVPVDLGIESFTHVEVLGGLDEEDHVVFPGEVSPTVAR